MEVHIMAAFVLGATEVEVDLNFVTFGDVIKEANLILNTLELDFLRILAVHGFENEFTFGEAAGKGLEVENGMDFALDFESRHRGRVRMNGERVKNGLGKP